MRRIRKKKGRQEYWEEKGRRGEVLERGRKQED